MSASQFNCDLCLKQIPLSDPRIHCLDCSNFDSCATCYVQGYSTHTHSQLLRQEIIRIRGFNCPTPTLPRLLEVPSSLLQPSQAEFAQQYFGDLIIPPMLLRLASAFFDSVDGQIEPKRSGKLNPEKYCYVCDLMGASPRDNVFKQTGKLASNLLRRDFELWGVEFFLDHSTSPPTALLSRNGFGADLAQEIARAPDRTYTNLNGALAYLRTEVGDLIDPSTRLPFQYLHIPRACFPPSSDPAINARGEEVVRTLQDEIASGQIVLSEQIWERQHPSPSASQQNLNAEIQVDLSLMHQIRQDEFDRLAIHRNRWGDPPPDKLWR